MATEIELKLSILDDSQIERLLGDPQVFAGRAQTLALKAIYYDTPDLALSSQGIGLRTRQENSQEVATLKYEKTIKGGQHERVEINQSLPPAGLSLDLFPTEKDRLAAIIKNDPLVEIARTDIDRQLRRLYFNQSYLELALDRGLISSGPYHQGICELEVELVSGQVEDLVLFRAQHLGSYALAASDISKLGMGIGLYQKGRAAKGL